jgi:predicted regulator of Ras-like GTPase activity (Roadblock/LC7/MglB family)
LRASGGKVEAGKVGIPLHVVLQVLPEELHGKVVQSGVAGAVIPLSEADLIPQLLRGVVRVRFGELRRAAAYVFSQEEDKDAVLVTLPLAEVLARVDPAKIGRRGGKRILKDPVDIVAPFEVDRLDQILTVSPASPGSKAATPSATPTEPNPAPALSGNPPAGVSPANQESSERLVPFALSRQQAPPQVPTAAVPMLQPASGHDDRTPASRVTLAAEKAPQHAIEAITVSLASVQEGWPAGVKEQLSRLKVTQASLDLPLEVIQRGLKRGVLSYSWKIVRGWIRPRVEVPAAEVDTLVVELPLKVIAPLFLAQAGGGRREQTRLEMDESIPDVFSGGLVPPRRSVAVEPSARNRIPSPAAEVPAETASAANQPAPAANLPMPEAKAQDPERFNPEEFVSRAGALEGVAGALVVLSEGLSVANRVPRGVDAERLSAFIPPIYHQMIQATGGLRMGELTGLQFSLRDVSWQIIGLKKVLVAAYSRPGEVLPLEELAALAGKLENQE